MAPITGHVNSDPRFFALEKQCFITAPLPPVFSLFLPRSRCGIQRRVSGKTTYERQVRYGKGNEEGHRMHGRPGLRNSDHVRICSAARSSDRTTFSTLLAKTASSSVRTASKLVSCELHPLPLVLIQLSQRHLDRKARLLPPHLCFSPQARQLCTSVTSLELSQWRTGTTAP